MKLSLFDYQLSPSLIAHSPVSPRDHSRMLALDRKSGRFSHHRFFEIEKLFKKGDVLVLNQTKVSPSRLIGKKTTGGKVELLLLKKVSTLHYSALTRPGLKVGQELIFKNLKARVEKTKPEVVIKFSSSPEKQALTPLPPYIQSGISQSRLKSLYQTVYAKTRGSVAAPTAGFHFTRELLVKLKSKGVQIEFVTLHVGPGTFQPVKSSDIEKHHMHEEYFSLDKLVARRLQKAKLEKRRIIAVGTTSCRVLESTQLTPQSGNTNLFIYPPNKFKVVDALITNFHLPRSTLLMLVSAFVSHPNTPHKFQSFSSSPAGLAYKEAIEKKYRFYSFGDAMFIS